MQTKVIKNSNNFSTDKTGVENQVSTCNNNYGLLHLNDCSAHSDEI